MTALIVTWIFMVGILAAHRLMVRHGVRPRREASKWQRATLVTVNVVPLVFIFLGGLGSLGVAVIGAVHGAWDLAAFASVVGFGSFIIGLVMLRQVRRSLREFE